ncbi:MAG: hypothetical protein HDQ96_13950 [Lachnospiraceae bacterium]|nr:hypothetical protein [Lachnospiraceae bacterium]
MNKRVRMILAAVLMSVALFGTSLTAFAAFTASPARPDPDPGTTTTTTPAEPASGAGTTTSPTESASDSSTVTTTPITDYMDDEAVPLAGAGSKTKSKSGSGLVTLLDEDVPLASPQTGSSVNMTVVVAILAGGASVSLLLAGKRAEAVARWGHR